MDPAQAKSAAIDAAGVIILATSPWWLQLLEDGARIALLLIAITIGVLRVVITWREFKRSRRWRF